MRRSGEGDTRGNLATIRDQKHALARLRHAVECGVQQGIATYIAKVLQDFADFFGNIVSTEIHHVWHVLHQKCERTAGFHVAEVGRIERGARVVTVRLGVRLNLPQFRSAYSREGLAWWTADDDIEGFRHSAELQRPHELTGSCRGDIAVSRVSRIIRMEVGAVGGRRCRVALNRSRDLEALCTEAEGKSAAP